jgi:hypothetical protein
MGFESQPLQAVNLELEQQRQTSARLLDDLAMALSKSAGAASGHAVSAARRTGHAAHYMQEHYVKEMAAGLGRFVRRHPAPSLIAAVLAGYAAGRALRNR